MPHRYGHMPTVHLLKHIQDLVGGPVLLVPSVQVQAQVLLPHHKFACKHTSQLACPARTLPSHRNSSGLLLVVSSRTGYCAHAEQTPAKAANRWLLTAEAVDSMTLVVQPTHDGHGQLAFRGMQCVDQGMPIWKARQGCMQSQAIRRSTPMRPQTSPMPAGGLTIL